MNFQQLQQHLEYYGCSIDHLGGIRYGALNCISAEYCEIERLSKYIETTLCHYFYELGVPAPQNLRNSFDRYVDFRENLVPADAEEE